MQKWEYATFSLSSMYVTKNGVTEKNDRNHRILENTQRIVAYLLEYGRAGWELVAIGNEGYVFKRPIE